MHYKFILDRKILWPVRAPKHSYNVAMSTVYVKGNHREKFTTILDNYVKREKQISTFSSMNKLDN